MAAAHPATTTDITAAGAHGGIVTATTGSGGVSGGGPPAKWYSVRRSNRISGHPPAVKNGVSIIVRPKLVPLSPPGIHGRPGAQIRVRSHERV